MSLIRRSQTIWFLSVKPRCTVVSIATDRQNQTEVVFVYCHNKNLHPLTHSLSQSIGSGGRIRDMMKITPDDTFYDHRHQTGQACTSAIIVGVWLAACLQTPDCGADTYVDKDHEGLLGLWLHKRFARHETPILALGIEHESASAAVRLDYRDPINTCLRVVECQYVRLQSNVMYCIRRMVIGE